MPERSRLARLQQGVSLAFVVLSLGWLFTHLATSPVRAVVGGLAIAFSHSVLLATQFAAMRFASRGDPAPSPRLTDMVRAWLAEVRHATRVFGWRQPFAWRRCPDTADQVQSAGARGIVFIHGFVCNRGFWTPWLQEAKRRGHPYAAVNLEPVFGSIDDYVPVVDEAVRRVTAATGMAPVLVCHSMGGLVARAWLRGAPQAPGRVAHVFTIGSPHGGTWLARFSHVPNGRQMRIGNAWLQRLAQDTAYLPPGLFTCWYSNCDNIVFPPATATLPGADNRLVTGAAHVDLGFRSDVIEHVFATARAL